MSSLQITKMHLQIQITPARHLLHQSTPTKSDRWIEGSFPPPIDRIQIDCQMIKGQQAENIIRHTVTIFRGACRNLSSVGPYIFFTPAITQLIDIQQLLHSLLSRPINQTTRNPDDCTYCVTLYPRGRQLMAHQQIYKRSEPLASLHHHPHHPHPHRSSSPSPPSILHMLQHMHGVHLRTMTPR